MGLLYLLQISMKSSCFIRSTCAELHNECKSQEWLTRNGQIHTLINNVRWIPVPRRRYNHYGKFSCEVLYVRAEIRSNQICACTVEDNLPVKLNRQAKFQLYCSLSVLHIPVFAQHTTSNYKDLRSG